MQTLPVDIGLVAHSAEWRTESENRPVIFKVLETKLASMVYQFYEFFSNNGGHSASSTGVKAMLSISMVAAIYLQGMTASNVGLSERMTEATDTIKIFVSECTTQ